MANLLLDPTKWKDEHNASPPSEWDGTQYGFIGDENYSLTSSAASAGDVVSFTLNNITPPSQTGGAANALTVYIGASIPRTLVYTNDLSTAGSFDFTSDPMQPGETCYISTNGQFVPIYSCDFIITPTPDPAPPVVTVPDCDEIGQVSKANASAFHRTRIHDTRLMLGEKRCLVANFNGAISAARTIANVKWRTFFGCVAVMANARVQSDKRSAAVDITANWIGEASIRCEATMDNGEVYIAPFRVSVSGDPIYLPVQTTVGPMELTAMAP